MISVVSLVSILSSCKTHDAIHFESNTKAEIMEFIDGNVGQVVSIAIVDSDKTYQYHLGTLSNGTAPNNQTIYEVGSITKTYTGLIAAKAILEGKVELDKDIRHYLKDNAYKNLEQSGQYITLRHLMTHTSGLPEDFAYAPEDIAQGTYLEKISNYSKDNFFDDLKQVKLNSTPGKKYQYSNSGTDLVAYILESVYHKPFEILINETIKAKSKEEQTKFRLSESEISEVTKGFDGNGNQMPLASPYWFASGGLTTDTDSMTLYIQHQLSSEPEVATSHQLLEENWTGHGKAFYWYTNNYDSNEQVLYQSGGSMGSSSWLAIYPKENIGIFIATNLASGNTQPELEAISDKIVDYLMAYNKALKSGS